MHTLSVERNYSKSEIRGAGRIISGEVQKTPEVEDAFRKAHNWRLHHAYPMVRERAKLTRLVEPKGGITAGRLKRMSSIRKKLYRSLVKLEQMQDLVGCRGILESMDDLQEVLGHYKSIEDGGRVQRQTNYVTNPKPSGYRSVHLIVKFDERGLGLKHAGCKVELQLRTQLQHVWATTIEAVGSMRNEDLKAGEGDPKWLRFMTLMSGHIAETEGQPRGEHLPSTYKEIKAEAKALSYELNAVENLSTFREFMNEAEKSSGFYGSKYTLKMNAKTGLIDVSSSWNDFFDYDDLDDDIGEEKQSLEVSVDNMEALRQAYPNYFADTRQFLEVLSDMRGGKVTKKRAVANQSAIENLDLSFLPKTKPKPAKPKKVFLEYTGIVYWGDERVGIWEQGIYGTFHFQSSRIEPYMFVTESKADFMADIRDWFEYRDSRQ